MDIIGKWKVKQLNIPTLDGVIQCTPDNMPEGEIFEEFAPMAECDLRVHSGRKSGYALKLFGGRA